MLRSFRKIWSKILFKLIHQRTAPLKHVRKDVFSHFFTSKRRHRVGPLKRPKSCTWQELWEGAKLNPSNGGQSPTHLSPVKIHSVISKTKHTMHKKAQPPQLIYSLWRCTSAIHTYNSVLFVYTRGTFKDLLPFCIRHREKKAMQGQVYYLQRSQPAQGANRKEAAKDFSLARGRRWGARGALC